MPDPARPVSTNQQSPSAAVSGNEDGTQVIAPTQPIRPEQPIAEKGEPSPSEQQSIPKTEKPSPKEEPVKKIETAVKQLNEFMNSMKRDLEFEFNEDEGRTIITVRDSVTQEIVRQLPPESAVKLAEVLQDPMEDQSAALGQLLNVET